MSVLDFVSGEDWQSVAMQWALYPAQWTILSYSFPAQNTIKKMSSHFMGFTGHSKRIGANLLLLGEMGRGANGNVEEASFKGW